jgi:GT2 family glycosyltransferase
METIDPDSINAELLERDDLTEPAQVVPPVVAVMVTRADGPWFEESLAALGTQDYPALSVLVLDNGSAADPTDRIAAALPGAYIRHCGEGASFAAAANDVLASVEGAVFLLFCHDDVALDPDAVRLMVEEAYRSNAGIVGPKVVDRDQPDVLLEVGMAVDHYGVPFSGLEPGEVDQEQHDGVRDVFFVSHAAMLVRADLFHELGGFDTLTDPGADDIDLCWRARLAGARVIVAPAARAREGTSLDAERAARHQPPEELRGEVRSRVRVLWKSYSALALLWVLPVAFMLDMLEAIGLLVTGRLARSRAVVAGWFSAFAHPGDLRRARAGAQRLRRVDDGDVRDLMIRGSARLRRFMVERVHAGERFAAVSSRTRVHVEDARGRVRRAPAVIATVLAVIVLFGVRGLLTGHVTEVGWFRSWPGVGNAWSTFSGSWRTTLMGAPRPASPVFALMSVLSAGLLDHPGLAQSLVVAGALPLGTFGAYRLLRPFSSSALPGVAAAAAYGANPIARNAIWRGQLGPLVCFALAPYLFAAFVRLMAIRDHGDDQNFHRRRAHVLFTIALLTAIAGCFWPPALLLTPAIALACCIAAPIVGGAHKSVVALIGAATAALAGIVLLAPWSFSLLSADAATLGAQPRDSLSLAAVLHFNTGRAGAGIASWGILAAGFVPLAIATGPRFVWAARAWVLALLSFGLAWLPGRLGAGASTLAPEGVLVAAAIALAFAAGLGVAAVLDDLRRFHFGWRQVMILIAAAGLVLAVMGLAADTFSGRFGLHGDDWPTTLSWMSDNPPAGGFRVLWVGDPNILPADAKTVGDIGFATTRDGTGDARALWAADEQHADRVLGDMLTSASAGTTERLGHLLAPAGVRYVVFLERAAPKSGPFGRDETAIADALGRQLDLTLSRVDDEGVVYNNEAWMPMHAVVPPNATGVHYTDPNPQEAAVRSEADGVVGVNAPGGKTAPVGPGTLLWSESANGNWKASADGKAITRQDAFGWTNAFPLGGTSPVKVHFQGSVLSSLVRIAAVVLWLVAIALWLMTARHRGTHDDEDETREELAEERLDEQSVDVTVAAE